MSKGKIIYQNWIVEIGIDPSCKASYDSKVSRLKPNDRVIKAVRETLDKLSRVEREFVERYYFHGESYSQIAKALNKRIERIDGLHRRLVNKLKRYLADFVAGEFDLEVEIGANCPICNSPFKDEINNLIKNKKEEETWKIIIKKLKNDYGIEIKSPQILIGHKKYHLT